MAALPLARSRIPPATQANRVVKYDRQTELTAGSRVLIAPF